MARRSSRRRKKRSNSAASGGKGLTTVSFLAYVFFLLTLVGALYVTQTDMARRMSSQQQMLIESNAQTIAEKFDSTLLVYRHVMESVAREPEVGRLLQSTDKTSITNYEKKLKGLFPLASQVRLLPAGLNAVDNSFDPDLSFACLDLMRSAADAGNAAPIEVHAFGTDQQHIDFVQPVKGKQDGGVIGHIQLIMSVSALEKWLGQMGENHYIELIQRIADKKDLILATAGNNQFQSADSALSEIAGTRWSVKVYTPSAVNVSPFNSLAIIVFGVAAVFMAIVVMMLRRSVSNSINVDLENFMQLALHVIRGDKTHDYPVKMKEFKDAVVRLHNMPMNNTMERERDYDPGSISIGGNSDNAYLKNTDVTIEELDEDLDDVGEPPQEGGPVKKPETTIAMDSAMAVDSGSSLPPAEIFKAYDIRGIVGKSLSNDHAEAIGRALGSEATSRGLKIVAFGRDGRLSGPELGQALVKGILSTGIDVVDVGMVPTPTLYFAAAEYAQGSGFMLTGSHNPPDYNGIKMVLGGETLAGDTIQGLRKRIEKSDFSKGEGKYTTQELSDTYIQRITSDVKLERKLKIVIDCGNGVAGAIAPVLFKQLGCEVIELFCDVDGHFPNHHPDPSQPENLKDVIAAVKQHHADLGLAFDGDGDRVGVISGDGHVIWPDRLMMLFAQDVLKRNPGAQIIFDIKCTSNLMKYIWDKGGEPLMWKTGHSLIKAKMKQTGALLAGEMSGHIFFKERWYGFDDALYSAARLLEILSADVRQPRVVFSLLPDAVNTPELNIQMPEGEHHAFMERLLSEADFGDANISMIDGVRADYADGWGLVRASNTTPCLVLRFEGQDEEAIKKVKSRFRKALLDLKPDLQLPF